MGMQRDRLQAGWETTVEPELTLILQILLYKYSVWDSGSTYGAKLQSLRYSTPKSKVNGPHVTRAYDAFKMGVPF